MTDIQDRVAAARKEMEALKERIKQKRDGLADTTRTLPGLDGLFVKLSSLSICRVRVKCKSNLKLRSFKMQMWHSGFHSVLRLFNRLSRPARSAISNFLWCIFASTVDFDGVSRFYLDSYYVMTNFLPFLYIWLSLVVLPECFSGKRRGALQGPFAGNSFIAFSLVLISVPPPGHCFRSALP